MIRTQKIIEAMWSTGRPSHGDAFANVVRAAIKAGLNYDQALALACEAYDASKGFSFKLKEDGCFALYQATRQRNATEHPNGKDAEDLLAEREGRASRWGTPEFHTGASHAR